MLNKEDKKKAEVLLAEIDQIESDYLFGKNTKAKTMHLLVINRDKINKLTKTYAVQK